MVEIIIDCSLFVMSVLSDVLARADTYESRPGVLILIELLLLGFLAMSIHN